MNIYDFDGTLYDGDSTLDFILFSLKKHPALIRFLPGQGAAFLLYALKCIDKTAMKERFYRMLTGYDAETLLEEFWDTHEKKIFPWYPGQHEDTDIVISASPEFLLRPICSRLGISRLIASRVDIRTGKYAGANCRGEEKVRRLQQELGVTHCDKFFSDSLADAPLAAIADCAYRIRRGRICGWIP